MGQAKRRGTFDHRKAVAIEKTIIERENRIQKERERIANMTEEECQHKRAKELAVIQLMSYCASLGIQLHKI